MTNSQDFQFFPPELTALQERELAVYKAWFLALVQSLIYSSLQRLNGIPAAAREPGEDDTLEKLEEERLAAQEFIDTAEPLTEEEMALKEEYAQQGFGDWSRRDFQQFVRGLETHGWCVMTVFHFYGRWY